MKRLFLLFLASGIVFCAYTQKEYRSNREFATIPADKNAESLKKNATPIQPNTANLKDGKAAMIDRYEIGKSGNIYSVLTSIQRCMAYDHASGTLLSTSSADPATYPGAQVMAHTSPDMGPTWDALIITNPNPAVHACRYPSGVLYNHDDTYIYDDIYAVTAGPSHTGGSWDNTYFASIKLDGSNHNQTYSPWITENDWARSSMTAVPGAVYNFGQDYSNVGSLGSGQTMKHYVYTTSDPANGFTLEAINAHQPDWLIDTSDGHAYALYRTWSAWALDGSIGYMWIIGVTNETYDYGVYQPQLAYTTDGGNSWTDIYINLEDHPTLVEYLPPYEDASGNPQTVRPSFLNGDRTYPGVVDYDGKLHLFSNVFGSSRGDVMDPDNGYWVVNDQLGGHIFDFIIDQNGLSDIVLVDSIRTEVAPDNSFGDVSWDHRLQACKSPPEDAVFCVWCEDTDEAHTEVLNPDIKGWGYLVVDGTVMSGGSVNFTEDDLYSGFYFFHYLAEITFQTHPWCNFLHISTSLSITEYNVNDPLAQVTHTYLGGLGFCEGGINEEKSSCNSVSLTQNIPNPAIEHTTFAVVSKSNAPARLEVVNVVGQRVYTEDLGIIHNSRKVSIDVSSLEAGVYFYTVSIANERTTKRMIVR